MGSRVLGSREKGTFYFSGSFVADRELGRELETLSLGERYSAAGVECSADHPVTLTVEKKNIPFCFSEQKCQVESQLLQLSQVTK
jgi:hypothetical protein